MGQWAIGNELHNKMRMHNSHRYWNDPEMLSKLGKAMGGTFDFPGLIGGAGSEATEEGAEEEEEEETLHAAASAGETDFI